MAKTYYDILGLRASATAEEIKRAYRKKAMESHPDVNPAPGAAEAFVEISEAYAILSDSSKRQVYNQKLKDQAARAASQAYAQAAPGAQAASQATRDEAYRQWVQQARAQAAANARMNYQDFRRSKFGQAEASVFFYLQFGVIGMFCLVGAIILAAPFVAMFAVDWKFVFLSIVLTPIAFRIFEEGKKGFLELKDAL